MIRGWHVVAGMVMAAGIVVVAGRPATAQGSGATAPGSLEGIWTGTAQTPNGEATLKVVFSLTEGKLGGTIQSSVGTIQIQSAVLAEDKLTVAIDFEGSAGTLVAKVQGNRIDGTWDVRGSAGPFSLSRGAATGLPDAAGDPVTGTWTGEAVMSGQSYPFTAELRLSGEAVTGEMKAPMGSVPLASGTWKDGTLLLAFPYVGGEPISMAGKIKDGRLSGVLDYNRGESTGTFSATKK